MKLRKAVLFSMIGPLLCLGHLRAERRGDQGLGVMVGNPSGLSWKLWMDENLAIDAAVGVARSEFDIHTTLLWHNFNLTKGTNISFLDRANANGSLPVYFGVGPRALFEHDMEFGIRFPVGMAYLPNNGPWEFFGEFAPVLRLTPDQGFNGDFAIGARYYFPAIRPKTTE